MNVARAPRPLLRALAPPLLSLASLFLSLCAVEVLMRWGVIPNEYYGRHEVLGERDRSRLFVFILGDSFMVSHPGTDIVDLLYQPLASRGVGIRNTATSGTGPVQYFAGLRREGARYRPDVVLLSYYVGNDLMDVGCDDDLDRRIAAASTHPRWHRLYIVQFVDWVLRMRFPGRVFLQSAAPAAPPAAGGAPGPGRLPELRLAGAFARARPHPAPQGVDYEAMRRAGIPPEHIDAAMAGTLNPWVVSLGAKYPDYYRDVLLVRSECAQRAWANTRRVLDLIVDGAAALGADVLPVIFPHTLQVSTAHHALYREWKIDVDDEMLGSHVIQDMLGAYFRSRGLEPLDLLAPFRAQTGPMYLERDEHLNVRGQQVAAELIADAIIQRFGAARDP